MKNTLPPVLVLVAFLSFVFGATVEEGSGNIPDKNAEECVKKENVMAKSNFLMGLNDSLLGLIIDYDPKAQIHLYEASRKGKALIERFPPYQKSLGANLGLKGFEKIPLHADLKVFENITFPKTNDGKVAALTFVYKIAMNVLCYSPIYDQVLGIVFDGAAVLAEEDLEAFKKFVNVSKIMNFSNQNAFYAHFIKTHNARGLVIWMQACPGMLRYIDDCLDSLKNYNESVEVLVPQITRQPALVDILFWGNITEVYILFMLASELPIEEVRRKMKNRDFTAKQFTAILSHPHYSKIIKRPNFCERAFQLLALSAEISPGVFDCLVLFRNIRLDDLRFDEAEVRDETRYDQKLIDSSLANVLIASDRSDEAVKYLPTSPDQYFLFAMAANHELCSIAAKDNPTWIKETFYRLKPSWALKDINLALTAFNLASIDNLVSRADDSRLGTLFFSHCTFQSIENMLSGSVSSDEFKIRCFKYLNSNNLCNLEINRYVQLLSIFLRYNASVTQNILNNETVIFISAERCLAVIEYGGREMLKDLDSRPFYCKFKLKHTEFLKMINSSTLRPKLFEHQALFREFFLSDLESGKKYCKSPVEVYQASLLFEVSRAELITQLLPPQWKRTFQESRRLRIDGYVVLMALARASFSADRSVQNYAGDDHFIKSLKQDPDSQSDLLHSVYTACDKRGKAIINDAFNRIVIFLQSQAGEGFVQAAATKFLLNEQQQQHFRLL